MKHSKESENFPRIHFRKVGKKIFGLINLHELYHNSLVALSFHFKDHYVTFHVSNVEYLHEIMDKIVTI